MTPECQPTPLVFKDLGRREVIGKFDVMGRLAGCFFDHRAPERVEHGVEALVGQRVFGLALGYEDFNDNGSLQEDCGRCGGDRYADGEFVCGGPRASS